VTAPKGAPNVVLILLDDAGFASNATFGGPAATPELVKLAASGLRYNQFHTTAICSPTRAALLTGRNHHQVGFGNLADVSTGYPAYNSVWRKDMASIAEVLRLNGYSTAAFGKWHNSRSEKSARRGPSSIGRPALELNIFRFPGRRIEPVGAASLRQHLPRGATQDVKRRGV
jgi:arylsulfatase